VSISADNITWEDDLYGALHTDYHDDLELILSRGGSLKRSRKRQYGGTASNTQTNLTANAGEFINRRTGQPVPAGTLYHLHPQKGPMEGATHSEIPGGTAGHDYFDKIHRKGGRIKKQQGGYLVGPSHEEGGMGATIAGGEEIELEGGEYIINAQTVNAIGTEFLDELNSTQTSYHQGGFGAGELPAPSQFKKGGKINKKQKGGGLSNLNNSNTLERVSSKDYYRGRKVTMSNEKLEARNVLNPYKTLCHSDEDCFLNYPRNDGSGRLEHYLENMYCHKTTPAQGLCKKGKRKFFNSDDITQHHGPF
jgi:hypothetical protein